jgi:hypothetical protein
MAYIRMLQAITTKPLGKVSKDKRGVYFELN